MKVICARLELPTGDRSFVFSSVESLEKHMKELLSPDKIIQHVEEGEISYTLTMSDGSLLFVPTQEATLMKDVFGTASELNQL